MRKSSELFTISLGRDDYVLTPEVLDAATDRRNFKAANWHWPDIKFISFKKQKLQLQTRNGNTVFTQLIIINKDSLQLACNCGMPVKTICIHMYRVLERASHYSLHDFFKNYRPNGWIETAMKYKNCFSIRYRGIDADISKKTELGKLYGIHENITTPVILDILNKPPVNTEKPAFALAWLLVHFTTRIHPPFVVPCSIRFNKEGTAIRSFGSIIGGLQNENKLALTEAQQLLSRQCLQLCKEAETLSGSLLATAGEESIDPEKYKNYFALWQQLLPLLSIQPHIFSYRVYAPKMLRRRPPKQMPLKIQLDAQQATIHFRLLQKKGMQQLAITNTQKGRVLPPEALDCPFFTREADKMQLLSSLKDAWLAWWMRSAKNRITVFKEHAKDFEKELLRELKRSYKVDIVKK